MNDHWDIDANAIFDPGNASKIAAEIKKKEQILFHAEQLLKLLKDKWV